MTQIKPVKTLAWRGKGSWDPTTTWGTIGCCWLEAECGRRYTFSLGVWPLLGFPEPRGWFHTHAHRDSTDGIHWVKKYKHIIKISIKCTYTHHPKSHMEKQRVILYVVFILAVVSQARAATKGTKHKHNLGSEPVIC